MGSGGISVPDVDARVDADVSAPKVNTGVEGQVSVDVPDVEADASLGLKLDRKSRSSSSSSSSSSSDDESGGKKKKKKRQSFKIKLPHFGGGGKVKGETPSVDASVEGATPSVDVHAGIDANAANP